MKRLYIFRTNLKNLEYYHEYKDLETFKLKCHDFYLNMGINFLENNYFDEVIVWRLYDNIKPDITFDINGKKFIQRWVNNFKEVFEHPKPNVTFFRGGFPEYCELTKINPNFFGLKLYLAAGKRLLPKYGGIYNRILIEDERDQQLSHSCIPFYKTTNSNIFKPLNNLNKKYDICIISNFSQVKYKGTDEFIELISKSKDLKKLKLCHVGNKNEVGETLCKKYKVDNIEFLGYLTRDEINSVLNQSKFGIVLSNRQDGCPRVITEVLTSGTPLIIKGETRVLRYYKQYGVIVFPDYNKFLLNIKTYSQDYEKTKKILLDNLDKFDMDLICKMNFDLWKV